MQPVDNGSGADGPQADGQRELRRHTRHRSGASDVAGRFTRYVLVPALVLGVLALIGYFSFRPARARLREWRSVKVVAEAEAALQSGNPGEAYRKVEVALQLAPAKTEVRRAAARIHTAIGSPEAVAHWQSVLGAPSATTEDRLSYIDGCLRFQRADLAFDELNRLEPSIGKSPEFLRRVVRYMILVTDYASAVPYAREAQVADPRDEEFEYLLGMCLLLSNQGEWTGEGWRLLSSIALASGSQQLAAARTLRATGRLSLAEARQISRALERRTDLGFDDRLTIAGLRLGNDLQQRQQAVAALGEEAPPANDVERLAYARWCLEMQVPVIAKTFLMGLQTTNTEIQAVRLDSAAMARDWKAMTALIEQDRAQLSPTQIACVEAWRIASEEGPAKAVGAFNAAIGLATSGKAAKSWAPLLTVAEWAERAQLPEVAISALDPLLASRTSVPWAARSILRIGQSLDRMEPSFPALRALRQYAPSDRSVLEGFSYVALLLNRDLEDAGRIADELANRPNAGSGAGLVAAFGKVRQGKPAEALDLLERTGVDPASLNPRSQAMLAVIRHAAGQRSSARQLAWEIPRETLKAEERLLLEKLD